MQGRPARPPTASALEPYCSAPTTPLCNTPRTHRQTLAWPTSQRSLLLTQLLQLRLRLLQPELHAHLAECACRGGKVLPGRLSLACSPVELAQSEAAVCDEWSHTKLRTAGSPFEVVRFGLADVPGCTVTCDLAEYPHDPPLVSPLPALTGQAESVAGSRHRIFRTSLRRYAPASHVRVRASSCNRFLDVWILTHSSSSGIPSAGRPARV